MSIQLIQSPNLKSLLRENIKSERENFAFEQLSSIFLSTSINILIEKTECWFSYEKCI